MVGGDQETQVVLTLEEIERLLVLWHYADPKLPAHLEPYPKLLAAKQRLEEGDEDDA